MLLHGYLTIESGATAIIRDDAKRDTKEPRPQRTGPFIRGQGSVHSDEDVMGQVLAIALSSTVGMTLSSSALSSTVGMTL